MDPTANPYTRSLSKEPLIDADKAVLVSGSWDTEVSARVAEYLGTQLADVDIKRFSDGESFVEIKSNVKGRDVYIIQSTCRPVNDNAMLLFLMISACKRAGCRSVTAIVPYYGYARQERRY